MDEQQRKAVMKETFDTVSAGYDGGALRFFPKSAEHMASLLEVCGDEQVLDVACGTGHASLALAARLPRGRVVAVDFSTGMLDQARKKAAAQSIRNIEFVEGDMAALGFPEHSFDAAVCAFGIFFIEDMERQLSHIASKVKPGGTIMISNFRDDYFHPLRDMMVTRISRMNVQMPPQTWKRIGNEAGCRELFRQAGLQDIRVETKNVGYYLDSAEQWWDIIWNAGFRRLVSQLAQEEQARFRQEHVQEVEAIKTDKGIWLDVGVLYTSGRTGGKHGS